MASSSDLDIDLHLKEIKYLFVYPELSPFEEQGLQLSGAEEAANLLRIKERRVEKISLNIFLPQGQIKPGLQEKWQMIYPNIVIFRILKNQRQLEIERAEGWRAVMIGLIFFCYCLLIVSVIYWNLLG